MFKILSIKIFDISNSTSVYVTMFRAEYKLIGLKARINKSNADGKCVRLVIYSTNN